MTKDEARAMRRLIVQGAESLDDKTVSTAPDVLPRMSFNGTLIKNGTRINWGGAVKRAVVDVWDSEESTPENAPTLWEDILYKNGIRVIPKSITAGLAFSKDERGWWKDELYKSLLDANVWTPEQNPAGWEKA